MEDVLFDKLNVESIDEFISNEIEIVTEEIADQLVGKHIAFTNHDRKEGTKITLPGKVIKYLNKVLYIYTNDIIYEESEQPSESDLEQISVDDVTNVIIFESYNKDFVEGFPELEYNEFKLIPNIYKVTNVFDKSIECVVYDADSFNAELVYKKENGKLESIEYPLYLIKSIERIKE